MIAALASEGNANRDPVASLERDTQTANPPDHGYVIAGQGVMPRVTIRGMTQETAWSLVGVPVVVTVQCGPGDRRWFAGKVVEVQGNVVTVERSPGDTVMLPLDRVTRVTDRFGRVLHQA